jgi:hypothetical protein
MGDNSPTPIFARARNSAEPTPDPEPQSDLAEDVWHRFRHLHIEDLVIAVPLVGDQIAEFAADRERDVKGAGGGERPDDALASGRPGDEAAGVVEDQRVAAQRVGAFVEGAGGDLGQATSIIRWSRCRR